MTNRMPAGISSESSNPASAKPEKNAAPSAVRGGSTRIPLEAKQSERLPSHRRETASDRGRRGQMSSATATATKIPRIARVGKNSSSAPASGNGIVGAAATGHPESSDHPG